MAYVDVPQDLSRLKKKAVAGLTQRQLIFLLTSGTLGLLFYWQVHKYLSVDISLMLMFIVLIPIFFIGIYTKDGRYMEEYLRDVISVKFKRPGIRPYETENHIAYLAECVYREEVLEIGISKKKFAGKTAGKAAGREAGKAAGQKGKKKRKKR